VVMGVLPRTLDDAARLVATHGIRADDAVQLASAMAAREADPDCTAVACFDQRLRRAAASEAFSLIPDAAGNATGPARRRGPANLA
jgi:uncharacterized protein